MKIENVLYIILRFTLADKITFQFYDEILHTDLYTFRLEVLMKTLHIEYQYLSF